MQNSLNEMTHEVVDHLYDRMIDSYAHLYRVLPAQATIAADEGSGFSTKNVPRLIIVSHRQGTSRVLWWRRQRIKFHYVMPNHFRHYSI